MKLFVCMKKQRINIVLAILVIGLILLYIINPLNKQIELNGWYSFILLPLVILRFINKIEIVDVVIRVLGVIFYIYLLIYYFL